MRLLRSFPAAALAAVLLSIVGLAIAQGSVGLLLVGGVLAAMSWYVTEGPRGRSLPKWTSNVLIIAVSLNGFVDLSGHRDDVIGVLGRFIVWLTLIKLYERKGPREYAQLLSLSLLLILLGCLQSRGLLLASVLVVYAALGLYVLLLFQFYASYERARAAWRESIPVGFRMLPSLQPIFGRHPELHFRSMMVAVALAGLLIGAAVFVIFPREVGQGSIGNHQMSTGQVQTGFADEVNLTSGTRITESRKGVLNLRLLDSRGRPFRHDQPLRLRGTVLDRYEGGGRWTATGSGSWRAIATEPPGFISLGADEAEPAPTITQVFEVLKPSRSLFSVYVPVSIATRDARRVLFEPSTQTLEYAGPGRLLHYRIQAQRAPSEVTLKTLLSGEAPSSPIEQFDDFDVEVKTLAWDLLASAGIAIHPPVAPEQRWRWNQDAAGVLTDYFHAGEFTYTLDTSSTILKPDRDPIVQFIFDSKRGHCEYFASALAAMCNCVGIPARLITGYVALEYDDGSDQYLVRESSAHAWVEVQTRPYRWSTFDPTPPATLQQIHGVDPTLADRLRWVFDRFEAKWSNGFVAFDRQSQSRLISTLDLGWSQKLNEALHATRRWMARVNRAFYLGPAGYIWMGTVALALIVAVIALVKMMRRSLAIRRTLRLQYLRRAEYQRMLRQLGFYLDMLGVLKRGGRSKPPWQPPVQYSYALARAHPEAAATVREITDIFYSARYGRKQLTNEQVRRARSLVKQLAWALGVKG
ncbi:MAG: transglutaminaseTgpA domain-containing protein [Planctomycetota bacterium]|nr:transglutaminaseTgpA domain-containing protein [Planctomycetota bacterium]